MRQRIISVTWDPIVVSGLKVEPDPLDLEDGDWVEWQFPELQDGQFGFISFEPSVPKFGPFHSLRSHGNRSFLGKGNTAVRAENRYVALILDLGREDPVASGSGTIKNLALNRNTAPDITVTYVPKGPENPENPIIHVSPDPVPLNVGDTATWWFVNTPANSFACFKFESADGNHTAGPFVAFSANSGGTGTVQASGMGFVALIPPDQWPKTFTYYVELRSWDGKFLAGHDPMIDNLGPPVPTES